VRAEAVVRWSNRLGKHRTLCGPARIGRETFDALESAEQMRGSLSTVLRATLALAVFLVVTVGGRVEPTRAGSGPLLQVDILLAFDTTGSMAPSIQQAKQDGRSIFQQVGDLAPDARFAVAWFRDPGAIEEYRLLQPLTGEASKVQAALDQLKVFFNPSPLNKGFAESYSLLFHQSYSDTAIGWRPDARKFVIVVGDAQPQGAGSAGLAGCTSKIADAHGLSSAAELAAMRTAKRTLIMIRQLSPATTVSLQCYESIAAAAYEGGAAHDGGKTDLAGPILESIKRAYMPIIVSADVGFATPGGRAGFTVTLSNPNSVAVGLTSLSANLPRGASYVRGTTAGIASATPTASTNALTWTLPGELRPAERLSFHFVVRTPRKQGRYSVGATGSLQGPRGQVLTIAALRSTTLVVGPRPRLLSFNVSGSIGNSRLSGSGVIRPLPRRPWLSGKRVRGTVSVAAGGRALRLRMRSYRLLRFGAPTIVLVRAQIVAGARACRGAGATIRFVDSNDLLADGRTADTASVRVARPCAAVTRAWSNRLPNASAAVRLAAR
jgi:hypothetical protein